LLCHLHLFIVQEIITIIPTNNLLIIIISGLKLRIRPRCRWDERFKSFQNSERASEIPNLAEKGKKENLTNGKKIILRRMTSPLTFLTIQHSLFVVYVGTNSTMLGPPSTIDSHSAGQGIICH
jgi:hypothetical protein